MTIMRVWHCDFCGSETDISTAEWARIEWQGAIKTDSVHACPKCTKALRGKNEKKVS